MATTNKDKARDLYLSWLRDAYGMEHALIQVMENHARDASSDPAMQQRIEQHLEQTRNHASLVKGALTRHGVDTSSLKTAMSTIIGALQAPATGIFKDELTKNALSDFATEQFEIACYQALMTAAEELGDSETYEDCRRILREEQAMAGFYQQHLPVVIRETLQEQNVIN